MIKVHRYLLALSKINEKKFLANEIKNYNVKLK